MLRVIVPLLLVVSCARAEVVDPLALLDRWLDVIGKQTSVRFEAETRVDGEHARGTKYRGVRSVDQTTRVRWDVTAHNEAPIGSSDYHWQRFGQYDMYLQHPDLVLPAGKTFAHIDPTAIIGWGNRYNLDLARNEDDLDPAQLLRGIDRSTARLVEHFGRRYVFDGSGAPRSGGGDPSTVRLTVLLDEQDRVVRVDRTRPTVDRRVEQHMAVYSDWGTAPAVERPEAGTVAKAAEVVVRER